MTFPSLSVVLIWMLAAVAASACGGRADSAASDGTAADVEPGASLDVLPPGALTTVAEGLDTPWEIRFLPDGDLLVTERRGTLLRIEPGGREGGASGARGPAPAGSDGGGGSAGDRAGPSAGPGTIVERHEIPGIREVAEAGLMGLALHPDYPSTPWIYVCHTFQAGGGLQNRVVRFRHEDGELSEATTVLDGMAGAPIHDGCRLEFGPDGHLLVTMGDAGSSQRAQDRASRNGKVLRLAADGGIPDGNPFGSYVWTWGHRNPQGLAIDGRGRLWSTEHGPSGLASGRDELNLVERGGNYGWPEITGDESREGMRSPVLHSGSDTWAPAGLAYVDGRLFFGALAGEALYEVRNLGVRPGDDGDDGAGVPEAADPAAARAGSRETDAAGASGADSAGSPPPLPRLVRHFAGELGRIRAVRAGPDGHLWFATSNRDGRGSPAEADDRVFRLDPAALTGG